MVEIIQHQHAIDNIKVSWEEVANPTMNAVWGEVWPACVNDFQGFKGNAIKDVTKNIVRLSYKVGFAEVDEDDVDDLLQNHADPLSNEELLELESAVADKEEEGEREPVRGLDIKTLQQTLKHIDSAIELLQERDPNPNRSGNVAHHLEQGIKIYREMYDVKRRNANQSTISAFFKHASPSISTGPSTSTEQSTSGFESSASLPMSPASADRLSPLPPPSPYQNDDE